jgi:hypothetical protein
VSPSGSDGVAGVTAIEVSAAAAPVPVRLTEMGLPNALNGIDSVPVRVPVADGSNCTPSVQVNPAPTVAHASLLTTKSPVIVAAETVSAAFR